MNELEKQQVQDGRQAIEAYRRAHRELHAGGWSKNLTGEHQKLLDTLLADLEKQGFASLEQFASASQELNIAEVGLSSKEELETKATEAQRQAIERMWQ